MKLIKKFGIVAASLMLTMGASLSQAADVAGSQIKVAVVNVQQILQQSPRVADLSKKLESQFKTRQTSINDEQKGLQDELDQFKKNAPTMSKPDRDKMEKKIEADRADLVKKVVAYQQDLQKEQNKIMQGILSNLNGIVSSIAKSQQYALVLDSQAVIFAADGNDITKDVAKQFNGSN